MRNDRRGVPLRKMIFFGGYLELAYVIRSYLKCIPYSFTTSVRLAGWPSGNASVGQQHMVWSVESISD